MKTSELLEKGKQLLVEKGWTKGVYARDENGKPCDEFDQRASCFCSVGALMAAQVVGGEDFPAFVDAKVTLGRVTRELTGDPTIGIISFNDDLARSRDEVLKVFDQAIAIAKSREVSR